MSKALKKYKELSKFVNYIKEFISYQEELNNSLCNSRGGGRTLSLRR